MSLKDAIANFIVSHTTLLQKIEEMAVSELITVIRTSYPNDQVLLAIVQKLSDELFKLQGIDQSK